MQKITPCLWFNNAEEAVNFYTYIFKNSKVGNISYYGEAGYEIHQKPAGTVLTIEFELNGQAFTALNGGPHFTPNPSISFFVNCATEHEVDRLWEGLSDGGKPLMPLDSYPFSEKYGWVQDKYGISWQLIFPDSEAGQKVFPSLMFVGEQAGKAEEAIHFYTNVLEPSTVGDIARYGAGQQPDEEGTVMYADFKLRNQSFAAMDSAQDHDFNFNEAISLVVNCETQEEIDYYWEKLSAVPKAEQCGWLKDKYGVSWQIVPTVLTEMLQDKDIEKSERLMTALFQMRKIDIRTLEKAFTEAS